MNFFKIAFIRTTVFILGVLFSLSCYSQVKEKKKKKNPNKYEWGNIGLGFPLTQIGSDVTTRGYGVDYNRVFGSIFLQGAIYGSLRNDIPSLFGVHIAPGYVIGMHKPVMIAMSIGAGYMSGDTYLGSDTSVVHIYRGLGGNGTVQLLFKPANDIGIGVEIYFNYPFLTNVSKAPASNGIRLVLTISTK